MCLRVSHWFISGFIQCLWIIHSVPVCATTFQVAFEVRKSSKAAPVLKVYSMLHCPVLVYTSKGTRGQRAQEDWAKCLGAQTGTSVGSKAWEAVTWHGPWSGTFIVEDGENEFLGGIGEQRQEVPAMSMPSVTIFWLVTVGWGNRQRIKQGPCLCTSMVCILGLWPHAHVAHSFESQTVKPL